MSDKVQLKEAKDIEAPKAKRAYYMPKFNVSVVAESIREAVKLAKKKGVK